MPTTFVKKMADKHGLSTDEAEKKWDEAKKKASDEGHDEDYGYVTQIFKNMMGQKADAYDPVLPRGMQPNAAIARLKEVATLANQAQAKRFLQGIGLQPTSLGQVDDNYISYRVKDAGESKTVNILNNALGVSGTKRTKDFGPPIRRVTKTIQWVWEVPTKGVIVYYPSTSKVAFMNRIEDNKEGHVE